MSSVPWNSFRSIQHTQAGKLPPSHRRSPLTKKAFISNKWQKWSVSFFCGSSRCVWKCGHRCFPPSMRCDLNLCWADCLWHFFLSLLLRDCPSLSRDRNIHIPRCLLPALPLCRPLVASQCDQAPIRLLQPPGHARAHGNRQKTITSSKAWDSDVLRKPLGNVPHHPLPR